MLFAYGVMCRAIDQRVGSTLDLILLNIYTTRVHTSSRLAGFYDLGKLANFNSGATPQQGDKDLNYA